MRFQKGGRAAQIPPDLLVVGQVERHPALGTGRETIADPGVRERAAHHHFVVAAP